MQKENVLKAKSCTKLLEMSKFLFKKASNYAFE